MDALDPTGWSTPILVAVYAAAACLVWLAGTRLGRHADAIVRLTGAGEAVTGVFILAGVTSLPEVAVTVTASARGHAPMAVDNLLGSISVQVAVLAVADLVIGKRALSAVIANPATLLQGALSVLALAIVAGAATIGDRSIGGIGAWAWLLGLVYVWSLRLIARSERNPGWEARAVPPADESESQTQVARTPAGERDRSLRSHVKRTIATGAVILVAGFTLSRTAEVLADRTGLGTRFVGVSMVAVATSLPEVSSVISAVRLGRYAMAAGDIFGTNLANTALVLLVDGVASGPPVLGRLGPFSVLAAALGIVLTTLYLVGFIERGNRTVWRMGIDSVAVLVSYGVGLFFLFQLR